jgi:hypothetical protein
LEKLINALPLAQVQGAVAFCGLDRGRTVGSVLKEKLPSSSRFFDVIPEEWALSREELPAEASQPGVEILRTDKGNVSLPADDQLGLVLFADSYHRLWDPAPLLRRFKEQMAGPGVLVVLDRQGPETESRRLANHRRRISSSLVTEEMRQAGFRLQRTLPAPTEDRFLLLFGLESPSSP